MALRQFLGNEESTNDERKELITVEEKDWVYGPTECANKECCCDLRQCNPIYTVKGKEQVGFCSQACRATLTGERIKTVPVAVAEGTVLDGEVAPEAMAQTTPRPAGKQKKAGSAGPKSTLKGILVVVVGAKKLNAEGTRGRIFGLAKTGMTMAEHFALAEAAGLGEGYSGNMRVLIKNGCLKVSEP